MTLSSFSYLERWIGFKPGTIADCSLNLRPAFSWSQNEIKHILGFKQIVQQETKSSEDTRCLLPLASTYSM